MPSLTFSFGGQEFAAAIHKVDRTKLYGRVREIATDDDGKTCSMMTLGSDGMTLVPSGGTAFGYLTQRGTWVSKSDLTPRDIEDNEIPFVASTLKQTTELSSTATIDEFLGHQFRLAYLLVPKPGEDEDEGDFDPDLLAEWKKGVIHTFPFSYRGGLQADQAFIFQGADESIWMLVGQPAEIEFVGFEAAVRDFGEEESEEGLGDLMDFGAL